MAQWGNVDNAANSVNWAVSQLNKTITTANTEELFGNTTANVYFTNTTIGQYGESADEAQAKRQSGDARAAHAGWVLKTTGAGGRAGRVSYEVLVASGSITGDAEDVTFPDYEIVISTQPSDDTSTTGDPVDLVVVASTVPSGGTLDYYWQVDGGPGSETWANVADGGVYSGATSDTLSISDNTDLSGNVYRVIINVDGADQVISANATITEA
jgi:hypothetical protein